MRIGDHELDAAKPAAGELAQGRGTPEVGIDSEFDPSVGDQRGPSSSISGSWRCGSDLMYPEVQPLARWNASINETAEMQKMAKEFALSKKCQTT